MVLVNIGAVTRSRRDALQHLRCESIYHDSSLITPQCPVYGRGVPDALSYVAALDSGKALHQPDLGWPPYIYRRPKSQGEPGRLVGLFFVPDMRMNPGLRVTEPIFAPARIPS